MQQQLTEQQRIALHKYLQFDTTLSVRVGQSRASRSGLLHTPHTGCHYIRHTHCSLADLGSWTHTTYSQQMFERMGGKYTALPGNRTMRPQSWKWLLIKENRANNSLNLSCSNPKVWELSEVKFNGQRMDKSSCAKGLMHDRQSTLWLFPYIKPSKSRHPQTLQTQVKTLAHENQWAASAQGD